MIPNLLEIKMIGIYSKSHQFNITRDSLLFSIKATPAKDYNYLENGIAKTTAKGMLRVDKDSNGEYNIYEVIK
jgi:hypothetical protein